MASSNASYILILAPILLARLLIQNPRTRSLLETLQTKMLNQNTYTARSIQSSTLPPRVIKLMKDCRQQRLQQRHRHRQRRRQVAAAASAPVPDAPPPPLLAETLAATAAAPPGTEHHLSSHAHAHAMIGWAPALALLALSWYAPQLKDAAADFLVRLFFFHSTPC
jgi:hypothetical protein